MTPLSPREYFNLIDVAVQQQIDLLLTPEASSERLKGQEILAALNRLYRATVKKYPTGADIKHRITPLTHINNDQLPGLNLSTIDQMLDAKISTHEEAIEPWNEGGMEFEGRREGYRQQISLRRALNISVNNIFNAGDTGTWGPLWGKDRALKQVEKELGI